MDKLDKKQFIANFTSTISKENFREFFANHGTLTIIEKFNIPDRRTLYLIRDAYGIKLTQDELNVKNAASVRESCHRKYGVDNPFQLDSVKEKIKNTNLDRYGVTCTLHAESIKEKNSRNMIREVWSRSSI